MAVPLVMIEWEDSVQPSGSWRWISSYKPQAVVTISSVGWLIHDGDDVKALAPNMGAADEEDVQISGVIHIPTRCVVKVHRLKEPKAARA